MMFSSWYSKKRIQHSPPGDPIMKMKDIPALPKINKPLNRRLYDLAWLPFGALAALVVALMGQAKTGFILAGLVVAGVAIFMAMNGELSHSRAVTMGLAFVGLGLVLTAAISLLTALTRR